VACHEVKPPIEDGLKYALVLIFGDSNIDDLQRIGIAVRIHHVNVDRS